MSKIFISYSHRQGDWVWERLVPLLKAGGAEALIDRERFKAGRSVVGQMDAVQDGAQRHLLILSDDYLRSDYCRHELGATAKAKAASSALVPAEKLTLEDTKDT